MKKSFIYLICSHEKVAPVKIGFSATPEKRLKQLQTGSAVKLLIFHREEVDANNVRTIEKLLHRDMGVQKMKGEWFNITPEMALVNLRHIIMQTEDITNINERVKNGTFMRR